MHVTRHFSLTNETDTPKNGNIPSAEGGIFCDWISIYQTHGQGLPKVNDGAFMRFDGEGQHESTTLRKLRIDGSFESACFVRSDGETVHFEGNVSKFGRPDNVFGYSFVECIDRINALLRSLNLPPFTAGNRMQVTNKDGDYRTAYTGARITRLDLTQNFQAGSSENAYAFMRFLGMQQASRLKTGTYGEGETVDFGRGSRRVYSKAYLKGPELLRHAKRKNDPQNPNCRVYDPYLEKLAAWCSEVGLVRFETTYKSTFLIDNCLNYLGGFDMPTLLKDFETRKEVFTRATCEQDQLTDLDLKTLAVYRMWQAGDDLTTKVSRATFYRHRRSLLSHGIDIAIKSNVIKFEPRTRVITLAPVPVPAFYERPNPTYLRLAA